MINLSVLMKSLVLKYLSKRPWVGENKDKEKNKDMASELFSR